MGFVPVRLEVVAINNTEFSSFGSGLTNIAKHWYWFLLFNFIKSRTAVTGGMNSNATPAQSPNVSGQSTQSDDLKLNEVKIR